jgi:uncharacterized protein
MPRFRPPVTGTVAIVTGASSPIGRQMVRVLAATGHPVLAVARRIDRLAALMAETGGAEVLPLPVDVTASGAADFIVGTALQMGPLGWLVNNAGGARFGRFPHAQPEREEAEVRLHCESLVALTARVVPALARTGRGVVLNVAAAWAGPGWAVHGASRAFVIALSEGLHHELRRAGVSVTALCPGPAESPETVVAAGIAGALAGRALVTVGRLPQGTTGRSSRDGASGP